jgi:hypothetical protein
MSQFLETQIESARNLPPDFSWRSEDYRALFERVERESRTEEEEARKQAHARAWELARQQGVKPIHDIKELQGDFWPDDDSVDDFLALVRAIRQDKIGAEK